MTNDQVTIEQTKNASGLALVEGGGTVGINEPVNSSGKLNQSAASSEAVDQLAAVFAAYNETTNRMREAHQRLKAEVARLRGELQQKNEQLERTHRLAALGQMAAGIAHEIRNPLGGIQLYASLLERDLAEREDQLNLVHKISKGVRSLDMIVTDILAFTQNQNCHKAPVHLAVLINEVIDYVQPHLAAGQVEIDQSQIDDQHNANRLIDFIRSLDVSVQFSQNRIGIYT